MQTKIGVEFEIDFAHTLKGHPKCGKPHGHTAKIIVEASAALKIILSDKNVKGILINIFGGIMKCDVLAQGVVEAAKEIKINVPLVVRLAGTNFLEGKKILDNSGLKLISAANLGDAAKKIVEAIK